jgi:hypothetical protein
MNARFALVAIAVGGCLPSNSEVMLRAFLTEDALLAVPAFPIDLVVDFGREESQRRSIQVCEWGGEGFLELNVPAPLYDRCPPPATIVGILVPHAGVCETGTLSLINEWPEDQAIARGEIVVFDDELCDVIEDRTLQIDPLPLP